MQSYQGLPRVIHACFIFGLAPSSVQYVRLVQAYFLIFQRQFYVLNLTPLLTPIPPWRSLFDVTQHELMPLLL
jgi:hypothetical protein